MEAPAEEPAADDAGEVGAMLAVVDDGTGHHYQGCRGSCLAIKLAFCMTLLEDVVDVAQSVSPKLHRYPGFNDSAFLCDAYVGMAVRACSAKLHSHRGTGSCHNVHDNPKP